MRRRAVMQVHSLRCIDCGNVVRIRTNNAPDFALCHDCNTVERRRQRLAELLGPNSKRRKGIPRE